MLHPAAMSRARVSYIPGLTNSIQRNVYESSMRGERGIVGRPGTVPGLRLER